jgi:aryl-alcohol dehydrogenase-like predicted oxidoreductase
VYYRNLGKTGLRVSEVGLGCNRLGEAAQPDEYWVSLVLRAVDLGVNVFDSSESYNWGRSEEMLGQALGHRASGVSREVLIATKMSRVRETNAKDFSAARMMDTVEGSLRRLQRECIDIYQLHSPSREDMTRYDWAEGLSALKRQGKIRHGGVAVNSAADGVWLIEQGLAEGGGVVEVLQITYNLFETEAEERLFDLALARGVGLLCRMPMARGILTGKFRPDQEVAEGHRARLDGQHSQHIAQAEDLRPLASEYEGGMTRMALHWSLTPPAISAIIPGSRTVDQIEENVRASNGCSISPGLRAEIGRIRTGWEAE